MDIAWKYPKRPAMLMLFGKVKTFLFDSLTMVTTIRPPATAINFSHKNSKMNWKRFIDYSTSLTPERRAIVHFWADGVGHLRLRAIGMQ